MISHSKIKTAERDEIARQTAAFLASGGSVCVDTQTKPKDITGLPQLMKMSAKAGLAKRESLSINYKQPECA